MFGLSKKDKVWKLVSEAADANLDIYRNGVKNLVDKEVNGEITKDEFTKLLETVVETYHEKVSESAIEAFSEMFPDKAAEAGKYNEQTCGIHTLFNYLCKVLTGKYVSSIDLYSIMKAEEKCLENEEKTYRDSLSR